MSDRYFGLVIFLIMLPVLIIMSVVLGNETRPKKNIILGVTLPYTAQRDAAVSDICAGFKKRVWLMDIPLALIGAPIMLVPYFSVQFTLFMLWTLALIAAPFVLYVKAHKRLKALKRERGWFILRDGEAPQRVVDLSVAASTPKRLSGWWFIPPFVISLIPVALALTIYRGEDQTAWIVVSLAFAGTILLGALLYPVIFRLRTDVAGSDARINAALTNVRRAAWGRAWIYIAWTTSLTCVAAWLFRESELGQLISILGYCFVLMYLCIRTEMGLRREQERLTAAVRADYIDEDEQWLWGMIYNNPDDRHLTVNARVGMNMTINLAKPMGKFLIGLTALIVVCMPLLGVWLMGVEFSPRRAEIGAETIEVIHLTGRFELALDDIDSCELVDELPKMSRVNGFASEKMREGKFSVKEQGVCEICLDPSESPFIMLTAGGRTYYFNLETPEETRVVFEAINRP